MNNNDEKLNELYIALDIVNELVTTDCIAKTKIRDEITKLENANDDKNIL